MTTGKTYRATTWPPLDTEGFGNSPRPHTDEHLCASLRQLAVCMGPIAADRLNECAERLQELSKRDRAIAEERANGR